MNINESLDLLNTFMLRERLCQKQRYNFIKLAEISNDFEDLLDNFKW